MCLELTVLFSQIPSAAEATYFLRLVNGWELRLPFMVVMASVLLCIALTIVDNVVRVWGLELELELDIEPLPEDFHVHYHVHFLLPITMSRDVLSN